MVEDAFPSTEKPQPQDVAMKGQDEQLGDEVEPSMDFVVPYRRKVAFEVINTPVPQGSMRAFVINGKPVITYSSKKLSDWRLLVASMAKNHVSAAIEGPVAITLRFRLVKPKSAPKKKRIFADKRPDLDKLIRAVLDAITGVVIRDDSQVVAITATKDYGSTSGVSIEVDEIEV